MAKSISWPSVTIYWTFVYILLILSKNHLVVSKKKHGYLQNLFYWSVSTLHTISLSVCLDLREEGRNTSVLIINSSEILPSSLVQFELFSMFLKCFYVFIFLLLEFIFDDNTNLIFKSALVWSITILLIPISTVSDSPQVGCNWWKPMGYSAKSHGF